MTNNFSFRLPAELEPVLKHVVEQPGDPLYNSLIFTGSEVAGELLIKQLKENFAAAYPHRETLYYTDQEVKDFIRKSPTILLQNFYKLHISLVAVFIENLQASEFSAEEQDKLALFLKSLTAHKIQVIACTQSVWEQYGKNSDCMTRELWSWFMSGRDYSLPYENVFYNKDLSGALTLTKDKKRCKWFSQLINSHCFGELYPGILSDEPERKFTRNMKMELGILWIGTFEPYSILFPNAKCPVCGEQTLIPYSCIASPLSGGHVIRFYCYNCKERIATNDALDYFHMLRDFSLKNPFWRAKKDKCTYTIKQKD